MKSFKNKYGPWALIAGGSDGLGLAFSDKLASIGINLVIIARREHLLNKIKNEIKSKHNVQVKTIPCDISKPEASSIIEKKIKGLEIGLLIYNAAGAYIGNFLDTGPEEHLKIIDTNCKGQISLIHLCGKKMAQRKKGGIIIMSSLTAFQGTPLISTYGATKAFNLVLAEGLWGEFKQFGVDVLACCAGATLTANYINSIPKNRKSTAPEMQPEDVVKEVLPALGRKPFMVPGKTNKFFRILLSRFLSRKKAITIIGENTNLIYGE